MRFSNKSAVMFMLPAALLFGAFAIFPTISGLAMSFTDAQGVAGGHFVGAANYRRLMGDLNFTDALRNTLVFAAVIVLIQNTLGIRFPVFVLITKCDKMLGFREFFQSINQPDEQAQV